jgi:hypothetical protein
MIVTIINAIIIVIAVAMIIIATIIIAVTIRITATIIIVSIINNLRILLLTDVNDSWQMMSDIKLIMFKST